MIEATRLNGKTVFINPHLIETIEMIEDNPDVRVNFINGKMIVVTDSPQVLMDRIIDYRQKLGIGITGPTLKS